MNAFIRFILKGYSPATMVVVVACALSLLFPPLAVIAAAAVCLVVLQRGLRAGIVLLLVSAAVLALFSWGLLHEPMALPLVLVQLALPACVLAWILRETRSLAFAVLAAGVLGVIGVIVFHLLYADPATFWQPELRAALALLGQGNGFSTELLDDVASRMSTWFTGIYASTMVLQVIVSLLLARWWQSRLLQPGMFGTEFRALRLPRSLTVVSLLVMIPALLQGVGSLALDVLMVLLLMLMLSGLAVLLSVMRARAVSRGLVIALFVFIVFLPQFALLLAILAMFDSWLDLRNRMSDQSAKMP